MSFTPEYIALCREVKLERKWEKSDCWTHSWETSASAWWIYDGFGPTPSQPEFLVWLPRLDQLLDLFDDNVSIFRDGAANWIVEGHNPVTFAQGRGSSREEAALRLYLAVRAKVPA